MIITTREQVLERPHRVISEVPLSLAYALSFFGTTVMPVWIGAMALRYGTSVAHVGLIASLELGCVAIASGLSAILMKKASRRVWLILALLLSILGNILAAFAPSLFVLVCTRIIVGAAHGFILSAVTRRTAQTPRPPRVFAGQLFALVAMAILFFSNAPMLADRLGPGAPFLFCAAIGVITLMTLPWLPDRIVDPVSHGAGKGDYSRHSVAMKLGGSTLLFCIQTSLWAYLEPAATSVGMSMTQLSHVLALGAAINLLAPIAAERLGERFGRRLPFLAGFLTLGAAAFLVAGGVGATEYAIGVVALSFSTIFLGPFVMASLLRLESSGGVAASGPAFFMMGLAIGPALGAALLDSFGLEGLAVFGVLAAVVAAVLFICDVPRRNQMPLRR